MKRWIDPDVLVLSNPGGCEVLGSVFALAEAMLSTVVDAKVDQHLQACRTVQGRSCSLLRARTGVAGVASDARTAPVVDHLAEAVPVTKAHLRGR